ncbi:putative 37S ribosomal protein S5, mitochondrial [Grifola frondosa]|uniref:Putative 37S ribosomal protein S5, mitochondrial n=1 Tax=Grifola frondosa TaxID=5627 RepID=A0A1C7LTS4_GRIFR|nr:putative 37S ribosomal protein S5, mitochondrial [Grifola frondosa]
MNKAFARLVVSGFHARKCRSLTPAVHFSRRISSGSSSSSTPSDPPKVFNPRDAQHQEFLEAIMESEDFPNLMTPDTFLGYPETEIFPPNRWTPYENKVVFRNDPPMMQLEQELEGAREEEEEDERGPLRTNTDIRSLLRGIGDVYRYSLIRFTVQQTGKGKIQGFNVLLITGNGNGLVGYGEAKDQDLRTCFTKAQMASVRNLDYVERFEKRTIWSEMETKYGSTRVVLRPRPVGFGLACNPNIHKVLRAAGIKDCSAKVWGSRNPVMVTKAVFRMLMPGHAPLGMGNGVASGAGARQKIGVSAAVVMHIIESLTRLAMARICLFFI